MTQNDGELAFVSLRDWFAGQAISGLVKRHRADVAWSEIAPTAYKIADAMLAKRSAPTTDDGVKAELLEALELHVVYGATLPDRDGAKRRALEAFIKARDAAIARAKRT